MCAQVSFCSRCWPGDGGRCLGCGDIVIALDDHRLDVLCASVIYCGRGDGLCYLSFGSPCVDGRRIMMANPVGIALSSLSRLQISLYSLSIWIEDCSFIISPTIVPWDYSNEFAFDVTLIFLLP
jgi:hypothetical protein